MAKTSYDINFVDAVLVKLIMQSPETLNIAKDTNLNKFYNTVLYNIKTGTRVFHIKEIKFNDFHIDLGMLGALRGISDKFNQQNHQLKLTLNNCTIELKDIQKFIDDGKIINSELSFTNCKLSDEIQLLLTKVGKNETTFNGFQAGEETKKEASIKATTDKMEVILNNIKETKIIKLDKSDSVGRCCKILQNYNKDDKDIKNIELVLNENTLIPGSVAIISRCIREGIIDRLTLNKCNLDAVSDYSNAFGINYSGFRELDREDNLLKELKIIGNGGKLSNKTIGSQNCFAKFICNYVFSMKNNIVKIENCEIKQSDIAKILKLCKDPENMHMNNVIAINQTEKSTQEIQEILKNKFFKINNCGLSAKEINSDEPIDNKIILEQIKNIDLVKILDEASQSNSIGKNIDDLVEIFTDIIGNSHDAH